MQYKCKRLSSIVFDSGQSNMTVVVLLHKHFSSWLSNSCNSFSIIMYCTYATVSKCNITAFVSNSFSFFKTTYVWFLSNTEFLPPVFRVDCTRWCRFMFLTHFGNLSQCYWRRNYISHVIVSPSSSTRVWWRDSDISFYWPWTRQVWPGIAYAKLY